MPHWDSNAAALRYYAATSLPFSLALGAMSKLIRKFLITCCLVYLSKSSLAAGIVKGVTASLTPPDMTNCVMLEKISQYPTAQASSDFLVLAMLLAQDERYKGIIESEYENSTYKYANEIKGNFVFSQTLDVTHKKEILEEQTNWLFTVEDGTKIVLLPPTIYSCSYDT